MSSMLFPFNCAKVSDEDILCNILCSGNIITTTVVIMYYSNNNNNNDNNK